MKISITLFILFLSGLFIGCNSGKREQKYSEKTPHQNLKEQGVLVAEPIIYDVVVLNPDPEDRWATEKLNKLNKEALVDLIFQAVEEGRVTAYNYHTEEKMSMKDIRALEKTEEFNKSKIGKIQFIEDWYWAAHETPPLDWNPRPAPDGNQEALVLPTGPADELETCGLFFVHMINSKLINSKFYEKVQFQFWNWGLIGSEWTQCLHLM